jgi:hypothetical protein
MSNYAKLAAALLLFCLAGTMLVKAQNNTPGNLEDMIMMKKKFVFRVVRTMSACESDNISDGRRDEKPGFQLSVQVQNHFGGQLVANFPFYCSKVPAEWEGGNTFYVTGTQASGRTLQVNSTRFDYNTLKSGGSSNAIVSVRPTDRAIGPEFQILSSDREGLYTLRVVYRQKTMGVYKGKLTAD